MASKKRINRVETLIAQPPRRKDAFEQLISDIHSFNINHYTREIYLHGAYNGNYAEEEPGVEYRMATSFVKNINVLEAQSNRKSILVHMHTIGGNWGDGMAIFNSIRAVRSPVTILGYAQASSMSGVILQAADKRVLMPDCEFMIHHGSISVSNNSMAAKSAIDSNERACLKMLQIFAERAVIGPFFQEKGWSVDRIISWMDKKIRHHSDWYLTAEEAIYYGLADGILGSTGFETFDKIRARKKYKGTV